MATATPVCIDKEIINTCSRIQDNSLLPIFRLPPEILAKIFILGARDYHESKLSHDFRIPRWVNISYVCRHWRDVALDCPTLWTYHFTVSLRWTDELLARSKQASLKIYIYCHTTRARSWWSGLVEKLLSHVERIQELRLHIPATVLPPKFSLCAPRLQILDIYTDCPLRWYSLNLSGVTTLSLRHVPAPSQQNIVEFLATLSRMQALTYLHLEHAFASARGFLPSASSEVSSKVGLPCLARLFFKAPLSTVVALLSCIDIPLKTEVRLEIRPEAASSVDDYAQIPLVLADLLSARPTIRSLVIRSELTVSVLCASEDDDCDPAYHLSMECPQWDSNFPLMIFVMSLEANIDADHLICDICCSIPLTCVQTLHVVNPPFPPDYWRKMLGHLHGLRRVKLSDGYMPDLVSSLALAAEEPAQTPRGHIASDRNPTAGFVPALEELQLYDMIFTPTPDDHFPGEGVSKQSLLDALSTRKALRPRMIRCDNEDDPSDYSDEYYD